jgi:hypothetical protein
LRYLSLFPCLAICAADVTVVENFPVCELLGVLGGGAEKAFDCHGVIHFSEIDANMPTICPLSDEGLGTCGVDTFEGRHEGSILFGEMLGAGPGGTRVYSLPLFKGSNFLKKVLDTPSVRAG